MWGVLQSPVPVVLSRLSCPGCPVPAVLSRLSCNSCPVSAVPLPNPNPFLSQISYPCCHVVASLSFEANLSWLSCIVCPAVGALLRLSCQEFFRLHRPVHAVVLWKSCPLPVLAVFSFWPVPAVPSQHTCPQLSCPCCYVLTILSCMSFFPRCPVLPPVLTQLSCPGWPIVAAGWPRPCLSDYSLTLSNFSSDMLWKADGWRLLKSCRFKISEKLTLSVRSYFFKPLTSEILS